MNTDEAIARGGFPDPRLFDGMPMVCPYCRDARAQVPGLLGCLAHFPDGRVHSEVCPDPHRPRARRVRT